MKKLQARAITQLPSWAWCTPSGRCIPCSQSSQWKRKNLQRLSWSYLGNCIPWWKWLIFQIRGPHSDVMLGTSANHRRREHVAYLAVQAHYTSKEILNHSSRLRPLIAFVDRNNRFSEAMDHISMLYLVQVRVIGKGKSSIRSRDSNNPSVTPSGLTKYSATLQTFGWQLHSDRNDRTSENMDHFRMLSWYKYELWAKGDLPFAHATRTFLRSHQQAHYGTDEILNDSSGLRLTTAFVDRT